MDSKQEYRQAIYSLGRNGETVISPTFRQSLNSLIQRLGLALRDAAAIEDEVLSVYRQYEKELMERGVHEYPLSEIDKQQLKAMRQILGLKDDDVSRIEAKVFEFLDERTKWNLITNAGKIAGFGGPALAVGLGAVFAPALLMFPVGMVAGTAILATASANNLPNNYEAYMSWRYGENWK
ncbi:hypothetical protein [Nostoc sp.]|uniref:hypothetical protein n=1 Tax=Nostoc sp. TaxID=1180 RepID=UPI002FF61E9C